MTLGKSMHLSVNVKAHCLPVDVPPNETVYGLKHKIHEKIQISPQYQNLAFKGSFLDDSSKLKRCGVTDGSRVHLAVSKVAFAQELMSSNDLALDVPPKIRSSSCNCFAPYAINLDSGEVAHFGYNNNCSTTTTTICSFEASPNEGRNIDTYLNHAELKPKGFIRHANIVQNLIESQKKTANCCRVFPTVIPDPLKSPSIDPLPIPYLFIIDPKNIHKNGSDQPAQ